MSVNLFKKSNNTLKKVAGNASNNINLITNSGDIDLNSYTEEGIYKLNFDPSTGFAYNYSNGPSSSLPAGGFNLNVITYGSNWISQIYTEYGSIVQQYVRNYWYDGSTSNKVWSDWAPIFLRYSENETFTGKYWINGKMIYSKVIHETIPASTDRYEIQSFDGTNVDRIINWYGSVKQTLSDNQSLVSYYRDSADGLFIYFGNTPKKLCAKSNATGGGDAYIIIEYTKN